MAFDEILAKVRNVLKAVSGSEQLDAADRLIADNMSGLLNLTLGKNPYALGADEVARVKLYRANMALVAQSIIHRIEREGPAIETLMALAKTKNDLAEFAVAQVLIDQLLCLAQKRDEPVQESVVFIITDRCNLRCKHCFVFNEKVFCGVPSKDELSVEQYVRLFKSIAPTKVASHIHITGGGEVFARKDFEIIIRELAYATPGVRVAMSTNGTFPERLRDMLKDERIRSFFELIQFSMDGLDGAHSKIRGAGTFEKLVQSIGVCRDFGISTNVITTILADNIGELGSIQEFCRGLGVENHRFQLYFEGSRLGLNEVTLVRDYITDRDRSLIYHDVCAPGNGCLAGIRTCVVRPNGSIESCRESYSGNIPRMVIADVRDHEFNLPKALTSHEAFSSMRGIKNCVGCASFCER